MNGMWIATLSIGIGFGLVAPLFVIVRGLRNQKRIDDALAGGQQLFCRVVQFERTPRTVNNDPVCTLQLNSLDAPVRSWTVTQSVPLEALARAQIDAILALRVDATGTIAAIDFKVKPPTPNEVAAPHMS